MQPPTPGLGNRLRVRLEGAPEDGAFVRLNELQQFLEDLQHTLQSVEAELPAARGFLVYRVVGLETGSAVLEIEAVEEGGAPSARGAGVVSRFERTVDLIGRGLEPEGATYATLSCLKALTARGARRITKIGFQGGGPPMTLPAGFGATLDRMLGHTQHSRTTLRGKLEQVNIHGKQCRFFIYPAAGPARVGCVFRREAIPDIGSYLGHLVEVRGVARYQGDGFPHEMDVEELVRLPPPVDLPSAETLIGSIPNLTGELSTNAYVESLRQA